VKTGFETLETVLGNGVYRLTPKGGGPSGMVFASGGTSPRLPPGAVLPDYWIDKYEVTNRQYQEFVSAGGYQNPKFWKEPFI
jgi:hypothetical protein